MFSRIAVVVVLIATALPASAPTSAQAPSPESWIEDGKTGCRIR